MNRLEAARLAAGPKLRNCIQTSFHDAGFTPGTDAIRQGVLRYLSSRRYRPEAAGSADLRAAIAGWYARQGLPTTGSQIMLTAGTSLAYQLLFRLNPRGTVLLPRPAYPLFSDLARRSGKQLRFYRLDPRNQFQLDREALRRAIGDDVGWIVVISPGNPGGEVQSLQERDLVAAEAERAGAGVIHDSVFETWGPAESADLRFLDWPQTLPVCRLGGLSKAFAAPDVKLSWMRLSGVSPAFTERLEVALDAELSVSALAESAARSLLAESAAADASPESGEAAEAGDGGLAAEMRELHLRVEQNRIMVRAMAGSILPIRVWPGIGGIHFPALLPETLQIDDEALAVELCRTMQIYCHPGYLYDFRPEQALVFSLLSDPEDLRVGLEAATSLVRARLRRAEQP